MSAINFARSYVSGFREKPHSSITDWVDILTSANVEDEAYDGIPELVDSISLQAAGPTEASRAIRKKLKHGDPHQQYRALVILKALVDNGGHKFQTSFADGQLTDALRNLASDPTTDLKVKKKLLAVFAFWHNQFKGDPSMSIVANMYKHIRTDTSPTYRADTNHLTTENEHEKRKKEEKLAMEENKKKAKEAEKLRRQEEAKKKHSKSKKKIVNFEQEKERPRVLASIATASQTASNLTNAIMLVNTKHESLQDNERVQECLTNADQARKEIVRYIQLVEDEDLIGTLIETNERVIAAVETYDQLCRPSAPDQDVSDAQRRFAVANLIDTKMGRPHDKSKSPVERSPQARNGEGRDSHPELQDLTFGTLGGAVQSKLPRPLQPSAPRSDSDDDDVRISLSDYSDYESSDEGTQKRMTASSTTPRGYANKVGDSFGRAPPEEDPFADPFTDAHGVSDSIAVYR